MAEFSFGPAPTQAKTPMPILVRQAMAEPRPDLASMVGERVQYTSPIFNLRSEGILISADPPMIRRDNGYANSVAFPSRIEVLP